MSCYKTKRTKSGWLARFFGKTHWEREVLVCKFKIVNIVPETGIHTEWISDPSTGNLHSESTTHHSAIYNMCNKCGDVETEYSALPAKILRAQFEVRKKETYEY